MCRSRPYQNKPIDSYCKSGLVEFLQSLFISSELTLNTATNYEHIINQ